MNTRRLNLRRAGLFYAFLAGLTAPLSFGNPSLGGPHGRSDFFKWRDFRARAKSQKSSAPDVPTAPTREWIKFDREAPPPESNLSSAKPSVSNSTSATPSSTSPSTSSLTPLAPSLSPSPAVLAAVKSTESSSTVSGQKKVQKTRYDEVLTEKQKAILRERAQYISVDPEDYDHLLAADEKEHLDDLLKKHQGRITSGE